MSIKREYVLRVIWTKGKDEIDHLSEEYTGVEKIKFVSPICTDVLFSICTFFLISICPVNKGLR